MRFENLMGIGFQIGPNYVRFYHTVLDMACMATYHDPTCSSSGSPGILFTRLFTIQEKGAELKYLQNFCQNLIRSSTP